MTDDALDSMADRRLLAALAKRDNQAVTAALAAGADPDLPGRHGTRPLHGASARGDLELVEILLSHGAGVDITDDTPYGLLTPLFLGVIYGHTPVVGRLLEAGASVDSRAHPGPLLRGEDDLPAQAKLDRAGWSPVHWAASEDDLDMLAVLLTAAPEALAWTAENGARAYALVGERRCRALMLWVAQGRSVAAFFER